MLLFAAVITVEADAQLKHLDDFHSVIDVGVARLRSGADAAYEAGFQYTNNGSFGVGFSYLSTQSDPRRQGFGIGAEKALYRPTDSIGIGLTLFGSVSTARNKTSVSIPLSTAWDREILLRSTITEQQTVFSGGAELYLHTPRWPIDVEPFLRAGYSIIRTSTGGSVQYANALSAACGADLLVSFTSTDRIILTQGMVFSERSTPALLGRVIFSHSYH